MDKSDTFEAFKAGQREGWAHFAPMAVMTTVPAARLVRFAGIAPGDRVLDVACGTGVVAITAARAGATVTGVDLTPQLLSVARDNASTAGVDVDFLEGDCERIPLPDASFDVVVSQFGHMFAPRPDVALAEMLRVLRPQGTIAFSTWPPELFVGRIFALLGRYMPTVDEVPPPGLWGVPEVVRQRFGAAVSDLRFDRDVMMAASLSPAHSRVATERSAGPFIKLVAHLERHDPEKLAAFRREYEAIAAEYFADNVMRQGFLLTRAVRR